MAEEKETKAAEAAEVVVTEAKKEGKDAPEAEKTKNPVEESPVAVIEGVDKKVSSTEEVTTAETDAAIQQSVSFKEESNLVGDLQEPEKKALDELKQLIQIALAKNDFNPPPPPAPPAPKSDDPKPDETPAVESKPVETLAVDPKAEAPVATADQSASADPKVEKPVPVELAEDPPKAEELAAVVEPPEDTTVVKAVVDEDGAKTVEAIEETIVPVTPAPPPAGEVSSAATVTETVAAPELVPEPEFIWGVPLVGDEKSDTVLLKFLRARDFKVKDALAMIKNAVIWRKQFGIEKLLEEDLALPELEKVVFYHGQDKESHPVCYNVYGEFQNQELYAKAFSDDEKRDKFLRWRIQFLEKGIRQQLDFSPKGVSSMVQVTDLKNVPGPGKKELRQATKKALALLQDSYPEFVAKQVFINVPWWYLAYNRVMSPFFTQRTKSKFVFAGPSKSAETLFRYIAPEHVPVQYGGLSKENDSDFSSSDAVTEVVIKPSSKHTIELPATEPSLLIWELRVLGWDVSYSAEFVPSAEDSYTVLVQKARKFTAADEPFVKSSFKVGEPGKIVLTIDNAATKKKKLLYRSKTKNTTDSA